MGGPVKITIGDEYPIVATTATSAGVRINADALPTYTVRGITGAATTNIVTGPTSMVKYETGGYLAVETATSGSYTAPRPYLVTTQAVVDAKTATDSWTFIASVNDADSVSAAFTTDANLIQVAGSAVTTAVAQIGANALNTVTANVTKALGVTVEAASGFFKVKDSNGNAVASAASVTTIITAIGTVENLGTGANLAKNLRDMAGSAFIRTTDSLEDIRDRGDSAWLTGGGGAGAFSFEFTVDNGTNVVEGATVLVSTTATVAGLIRQGNTNSLGKLTLNFSAAGDYFYKILPTTGLEESAWTAFTVTS